MFNFDRCWRAGATNPGFGFVVTDRNSREVRSRSWTSKKRLPGFYPISSILSSFERTISQINKSGNYGEKVTPVPIPNTEVKLLSADGSWGFAPVRVGRCQAEDRNLRFCLFLSPF